MNPGTGPLVSIVLSCFNSERFLADTLRSVLSQTHENWELIAVDDCSRDSTRAMLHAAAASDARIRVIEHERNAGRPSITRNTAIAQARGDFLQFIDHDDVYLPQRTQVLLEALNRHPECCVAFCNMRYMGIDGVHGDLYLPEFLKDAQQFLDRVATDEYQVDPRFFVFQSLRYSALQTNTCLIDKRKLRDFNLRFDETLTIAEDKDYWIRLGLHGGLLYIDQPLVGYRLHDTNITRRSLLVASDLARFTSMNRHRIEGLCRPTEQIELKRHESLTYANLGWAYRCAGRHTKAFASYLKALRLEPTPRAFAAMLKSWLPAQPT